MSESNISPRLALALRILEAPASSTPMRLLKSAWITIAEHMAIDIPEAWKENDTDGDLLNTPL